MASMVPEWPTKRQRQLREDLDPDGETCASWYETLRMYGAPTELDDYKP